MRYIESLRTLQSELRDDRAANAGRSARTLLWLFRVAGATQALPSALRFLTAPIRAVYRSVSTTLLGAEIPLGTRIGPGLALPHHRGVVLHHAAEIGPGSTLRHNVTIGVRRSGESTPKVPRLGPGVDVGAGAQILGDVEIGAGARIGAGAIVLCDVPEGGVAVGNPARVIGPSRR
ncbi:serine acetyltransferase [Curtobacterium sp. SGAir0471]|uniref:serine acetyltransferase n=1 Tax=Curtobacterium sp. SGAir0471 TaxID=2070337 RepID=UPI0010CCFC05|nr:serine acetyltransferase [Curtobacterium sp. SGAir0471]QCR42508.1 serine acetyltransferase [Curtobacterium sp. SGAir0471]